MLLQNEFSIYLHRFADNALARAMRYFVSLQAQ